MMNLKQIVIILFVGMMPVGAGANDFSVEWHPNDRHVNVARGINGYPLSLNTVRGATAVGMRAVLWLPPGTHCEALYDSSYGPGTKVLHLFLDATYVPQCLGHKYAHYDTLGGYCQVPDRVHWNVALPVTRLPEDPAPVAELWWMGVKMEPLRGTDAHFSLSQTWAIANDKQIPYVVGDPTTPGAQEFQTPTLMDCRDAFP